MVAMDEPIPISISPEKVCFIIVKAHEFDAKVPPVETERGSNPVDEADREILEDFEDDPTFQELVDALDALNEDEQVEILAMMWLGRGDYTVAEWQDALAEAREARNEHEVNYLVGTPLLGDYLEEALSMLGYSCEEFEIGRL